MAAAAFVGETSVPTLLSRIAANLNKSVGTDVPPAKSASASAQGRDLYRTARIDGNGPSLVQVVARHDPAGREFDGLERIAEVQKQQPLERAAAQVAQRDEAVRAHRAFAGDGDQPGIGIDRSGDGGGRGPRGGLVQPCRGVAADRQRLRQGADRDRVHREDGAVGEQDAVGDRNLVVVAVLRKLLHASLRGGRPAFVRTAVSVGISAARNACRG
ncbi:DUF6053 domain-containing protein [Lysobacter enzymogenes]|uniref:DUF6053 domain-containing protein n=1 Tax=Lysobacter enzymogenes TaxID=69 RepID=UPI003747F043